jgi:hypothetical protein
MKIYILGSTAYQIQIHKHARTLLSQGHEPIIPAFDSESKTVLQTLTRNRELMKMSDEVHLIYDGRSHGSIFDFGMCFAMRKPLKIIYISPKNIVGRMREYAEQCEKAVGEDV